MSVTKRAALFLGIALVVSWPALFIGWLQGQSLMSSAYVGPMMIAGPLVGASICTITFERERRMDALGLRFTPNWWWIAALLLPLAVGALSMALTILLSDRSIISIDEAIARGEQEWGRDIDVASVAVLGIQLFVFLTVTEEVGWRGYLYHLWRPSGFWRTSLAIGLVQGVWHLPVVLFSPGSTSDRLLLAALYPLFGLLWGPAITVLRDRGRSIWATGLFHTLQNGAVVTTTMMLIDTSAPWNGMSGIGGFIALLLLNAAIPLLGLHRRQPGPRPGHPHHFGG
jgi:uncharacterized protein